jgi:thiol-disulfide isomerase/thioredoxin
MTFLIAQCCDGTTTAQGGTGFGARGLYVFIAIATFFAIQWLWGYWRRAGAGTGIATLRAAIIVILVSAVVAVIAGKQSSGTEVAPLQLAPGQPTASGKPALLDFGSDSCIPCQLMAPILAELKTEQAASFEVHFVDVWKDPQAGKPFAIESIPTQVFLDGSGRELWRHQGFLSKSDILAKWMELGVAVKGGTPSAPAVPASAPATAPSAETPATSPATAPVVAALHPDLVTGALSFALPAELPADVLVQAGDYRLTQAKLDEQFAGVPAEERAAFTKSLLFLVDRLVSRDLLLAEARATPSIPVAASEADALRAMVEIIGQSAAVGDDELVSFYSQHKASFGGAPLEPMREQLRDHLLQQKQAAAIDDWIRALGQRRQITINHRWLDQQAKAAQDNDVDRARSSGLPTIVDFGAVGCQQCDMMAPILESMKKSWAGKANVLFIDVRHQPVLAQRYRVKGIPTQVFIDRSGQEVSRHQGFYPQAELERHLAEMGARRD